MGRPSRLRPEATAVRAFIVFGVGPRLWSGPRVGRRSRFGTAFAFGTVVGVGWRLRRSGLFLRLEHTSNAGIRDPKPGLDMVQLGLAWRLGER